MADDTTPSRHEGSRQEGAFQTNRSQGGRAPGNREPGGFRIRLSDNEMRAARAIQEAFQLRSTVAALGFALRTVAQMLEDGQLDELVAQQQAQGARRPSAGGRGGDGRGGDGRGGDGRSRVDRDGRPERPAKANPFARPSKPPAAVAPPVEGTEEDASMEIASEVTAEDSLQISSEAEAGQDSPDLSPETSPEL